MFFLLTMSPWPVVSSIFIMSLFLNILNFLNFSNILFMFSILNVFLICFCWWMDVIIESSYMGFHNKYIMKILMFSMLLFIISEVFLFFSFFWSFFHFFFSPDIFIGFSWPPQGIFMSSYMNIPFLNSMILISSGCSLTWSHYKLLSKNLYLFKISVIITIILGLIFLIFQMFEYYWSYFCMNDSNFGSIFFLITGFHGIHVMMGLIFITSMLIRSNKNHFSNKHMLGFEFSIWYWHFVDVVWLYLFMIVYWIGS